MMECEIAKTNNNNHPFCSTSSSPPQSPTAPIPISPPLRNPNDECFNCKEKGHLDSECPNKTPKKPVSSSPNNSNNNSIIHGSISPMIRSPCGRGFCLILISKSEKSPSRMYYKCPVAVGNCDFFKWYDELSSITARTPMCPCGVGICSVNKASSPTSPKGERWYYAWRIKKNHGDCNFLMWADSEQNNTTNQIFGSEINGCSSLLSRLNDLDIKETSSEINGILLKVKIDVQNEIIFRTCLFIT